MPSLADGFQVDPKAQAAIESRSRLDWPGFIETVFEIDQRLVEEGIRPFQRPMRIAEEINTAAGNQIVYAPGLRDPVSDGVHALLRATYGERALGMGPIHVGTIMIRDAFIPFYVPGGYGSFRVNPWDFVDRATANVELLSTLSPADARRANDQIMDVWDFGWMVADRRVGNGHPSSLLVQARDQIETACMALQGSFSQRIALQGTAYAVELTAKALLAEKGWSKTQLSSLSHNLVKCLRCASDEYAGINRDLILHSTSHIPYVVKERYGENEEIYTRRRIGDVVSFGQYILGELARACSTRDSRANSNGLNARVFPTMPPSA